MGSQLGRQNRVRSGGLPARQLGEGGVEGLEGVPGRQFADGNGGPDQPEGRAQHGITGARGGGDPFHVFSGLGHRPDEDEDSYPYEPRPGRVARVAELLQLIRCLRQGVEGGADFPPRRRDLRQGRQGPSTIERFIDKRVDGGLQLSLRRVELLKVRKRDAAQGTAMPAAISRDVVQSTQRIATSQGFGGTVVMRQELHRSRIPHTERVIIWGKRNCWVMSLLFLILTSLVEANGIPGPGPPSAEAPVVEIGSKRTVRLFPVTDLYPANKADLHRPRFGIAYLSVPSVGIAESGEARFDLRLGGRFGLVRVTPRAAGGQVWQISVIAGFDSQFDIDNSFDNIGWDGNYGLAFTSSRDSGLAFKLSIFHTSSHVGDEYAERTGRRRIGYTREEVSAGISWAISPRWRTYTEAGWAYSLRNEELQEPGRAQFGLEYESAESLWNQRLGWYVALDLSATQERDWRLDTSVDMGFLLRSGNRQWRVGVGYYDGRVPLGEFFQDEERYLSFGLWFDA